MVCGAAVNYKWKQKGFSSAFLAERDPYSHILPANPLVSPVLDY